jgi:hypothetical protein
MAFTILSRHLDLHDSFLVNRCNSEQHCAPSGSRNEKVDSVSHMLGWKLIGHTSDEQARLQDLSTVIAAWPVHAEDNVPAVPCLSTDGHLLLLSAGASRVRYGASVTFVMVSPTDVKKVLPRSTPSQPLSAHALSLWCIFDDGSVSPAYSYES